MTATYSDGTTADVTSSATFTGYDMSTASSQTVTVSYTEGNVTKTTTYGITVSNASTGDAVVLIIDGAQLTSTATTGTTTKTYSGVSVTFSDGAKQLSSTGDNKFTDKAILIGKSGKNIHAAIPGKITKFEIYANKGASSKVSVGVNFSDTEITAYNASANNTYKNTLETLDHVYDCSASLSSNAHYFWYQVTNANNSQVEFRITYIPDPE